MPVLGEVSANPILTEMAQMFGQPGFIADQLFPTVPGISEVAGRFLEVDTDQEAERLDQLERAVSSRPARFQFNLSDAKTYSTKDRTVEHPIDDTIRRAYKSILDMERAATMIATRKILLVRENLVAAAVTDTANYAAANRKALSGTGQWSDADNSTPIEDIEAAIEQAVLSSGFRPNTFWVGRQVWTKLKAHPDIVGMLGSNALKTVSADQFAGLFGFERVAVGDAIYVSSARGATIARAFLWGKNAGLAYVSPVPSLFELTLGVRVPTEEVMAGVYRDETIKSDVVRVGEDADYVFLYGDAGYLFSTAVA